MDGHVAGWLQVCSILPFISPYSCLLLVPFDLLCHFILNSTSKYKSLEFVS